MPNRIIKESFKTSPQIDMLTWFEECVWHRLCVTVDDFGRFEGRITILKNQLFPTKENVSKSDIEKAIRKLESVGLIQTYEVDGVNYVQIKTWSKHQQIRNKKSKYPEPLQSIDINCNQMISNDINCYRNPIQSNPNPIQSKSKDNKFKKPTLLEVEGYIQEKALNVNAHKFIDYYESNGWKVGRNPMKDWKACIRRWNEKDKSKPLPSYMGKGLMNDPEFVQYLQEHEND